VGDILNLASQQHISLFPLLPSKSYGFHHLVEVAEYLLSLGKDLLVWVGRWALKCLISKDVREISMTQAVAKVCLELHFVT